MSQLPDLFPVEGVFDPKPVQSDLPDLFPDGLDPATTGAMARQARGLQQPQAVQDIQISRELGQDPGVVSRNRDDLKLRLETAQLEETLVGSPGVRAFIHKSPHHMAAAKDEAQGLADLERFLQKGKDTMMVVPKTVLKVGPQMAVSLNQGLAMLAGQLDTAAQGIEDMTGLQAGGVFGEIRNWLYEQNKPLEEYMQEYLSPSEEVQKPLWGNWELLADPEYLAAQTGDALVSFVPMILGAAATGGSSLVAGVIGGFQEASSMYQDLIEEGVDPASAGFWSPIFGVLVGKLNQIGFDKIMSANVANSFLSRIYNRVVAGGTEALTEYAEEPTQAFLSSIARGDDVDTTISNTFEALKNVDVAVGAFFMGAGLHGSHMRRDIALAQASEQEQQFIDMLTQSVETSNLAKLDPQLYQEAVAILKDGGQIQNIFIPASAIATNFGMTAPGADMAALTETLNQLGVTMEAYDAALIGGHSVAVPVENYAATIAAVPDFAARFQNDRKLSEDSLTRNELEQHKQDLAQDMQRILRLAQEDSEAATVEDKETKTIFEDALRIRQDAGRVPEAARSDALQLTAFMTNMARQSGGVYTATQLWEAYKPRVTAGQPAADQQALQQDAAYAGVENEAEIEEARRLWAEMGVESPYFKRWSGGAPVVLKNAAPSFTTGQPVVVEADHGSPDIRFVQEDGIFKSEKERYGFGRSEAAFWFSRDTATAKTYADPRRAFDYQNAEPGVVSAFVRLDNPLVVDAGGQNWRDAQKRGATSDVIREARENGHDGVIIYNVKDDYNNDKKTRATTTLTVFSSNQIKSVNNRGTFDPADARILRQEPGPLIDPFDSQGEWAVQELELEEGTVTAGEVIQELKARAAELQKLVECLK